MSHGLYYCNAETIRLGLLETFQIVWSESAVQPGRVLEAQLTLDEFKDRYTVVRMTCSPEEGPCIKKLRYQHTSGETGFDEFHAVETDATSDEELIRLYWWFMSDAWTWNHKEARLTSFAEKKPYLTYPSQFFLHKPPGFPEITFHSPEKQFFEIFQPKLIQDADLSFLENLMNLMMSCRMIALWQPSYGNNPVLFSRQIIQVLRDIDMFCNREHILCREVKNENLLPEWQVHVESGAVVGLVSWQVGEGGSEAIVFVRPIKSIRNFLTHHLK